MEGRMGEEFFSSKEEGGGERKERDREREKESESRKRILTMGEG